MCAYRSRVRLPVRVATLALSVALLSHGAWAGDQAPRDPAAFLPQDTILLAKVAMWQEWSKAWDQTSLAGIGQEAELKAFLSGPLNRLQELVSGKVAAAAGDLAPSVVSSFLNTLGDLAPGPIVVALCYSEQDVAAKRAPAVAVILGTRDASKITNFVQVICNLFAQNVVKQEQYGGADLLILQSEKLQMAVTFHKGQLIVTTRPELCKQIVDGLAGTLAKKLSDNEAYQACKLAGDEHQSMFLDIAALRQVLSLQAAARGEQAKDLLAEAGLKDLRAVAWSLRMNGKAFESRMAVLAAGQRAGWLAALDAQPMQAEALKVCKPGCSFALGARVQADRLLTILEELMRRTTSKEEFARFQAAVNKGGADKLKQDLAGAFGGDLVVTNYTGKEGAPPGALMTGIGTLSVTDAGKAEAVMTDLMKRLAAERGEAKAEEVLKVIPFENAKLLYLDAPKGYAGLGPVFGLTPNRLVVALDMQTLKAAVRGLSAPGLEATPAFQDSLKAVGGDLGSVFVFIDYGELYASVFSLGATALKFVGSVAPLREIGVDLNLLPSTEAVTRHLFPSLAVLRASDKGATVISHGPLPSPEVLAPPVAAIAAIVATFTADLGKK